MLGLAATLALVGACASGARDALGLEERRGGNPVGFSDVRFTIEDPAAARAIIERIQNGVPTGADGRFDLIALSGGGAAGAYTAGVMNGWTERGDRPDFEMVTGVSTGALAAPFVFLGPEYDARLREAYTGGASAGLMRSRGLGAFVGSGLFSSAPLRALIADQVDEALLAAIAAEHRKGRILMVATTDLDAQRGVVWNLGSIADRGGPEALALFREVLAASASIPGAFPPVMIEAQGAGAAFREMHVDGGVMNPFVAIPQLMWTWTDTDGDLRGGRIHVLVNGKASPVFAVTPDAAGPVLGRSLDTALKANLRANLTGNRAFAQRNGMEFRVSAIPLDFEGGDSLDFSPEAMASVYAMGHHRGVSGEAWAVGPVTADTVRPVD